MPLYTITTQVGVLDGPAKTDLADKLTAFHTEYAAVPGNWVHIVFHDYPNGSGFTAGRPSSTVVLTLLIRAGRSADYEREMLRRLWSLMQAATGAPDEEIVVRNGFKIGRASISVTGDQPFSTHALVLAAGPSELPDPYVPDAGKYHWLRIGVPGRLEEAGGDPDPAIVARIKMARSSSRS